MDDGRLAPIVQTLRLRSPVYSTPLLADVDGDGSAELFVAAGRLHAWRLDPRGGMPAPIAGWPRSGRGPFASSPKAGDIDGDGHPEIVVGSDDDALYAWRLDGSPVAGFPFPTGGDIYSTPVLADLDGDGRLEIIFGSDDGKVYAIDGEGRPLPGWPVSTGGFVAASPAVADLDGDGRLEVVIGSWDRKLYVIDSRGEIWSSANGHPAWPLALGHIIWSSPLLCDIDGDGRFEIAVAAESLHLVDVEGMALPGWPRPIGGFTVSSPAVTRCEKGTGLAIGGERLHLFDRSGIPGLGYPQDLRGHIWARPLAADLDGDGRDEIYVGSWSGMFHAFTDRGAHVPGFPVRTRGAIFGGAASMMSLAGVPIVAFGSTDGCVRILRLPQPTAMAESNRGVDTIRSDIRHPEVEPLQLLDLEPSEPHDPVGLLDSVPASDPVWTLDPPRARAGRPVWLCLSGVPSSLVRAGFLVYRWEGSSEHPSPLVPSEGRLVAIVQPLPAGTEVSWHVTLERWDGEMTRFPQEGEQVFLIHGAGWDRVTRFLGGTSLTPPRS